MFTTTEQRQLFDQILDLNFEASKETDLFKKGQMEVKVSELLFQLKTLMGDSAYNTFMNRGKQMFAPIR